MIYFALKFDPRLDLLSPLSLGHRERRMLQDFAALIPITNVIGAGQKGIAKGFVIQWRYLLFDEALKLAAVMEIVCNDIGPRRD